MNLQYNHFMLIQLFIINIINESVFIQLLYNIWIGMVN